MQDQDATAQRYKLMRRLARSSKEHGLLEDGDRVMVAVSGGKDSYLLVDLLADLVPRLPFRVELVAVHLDQQQPDYDGRPLIGWLEQRGVPFEILSEDTFSVVTEKVDSSKTYCSLCSRLRRGILYSAAERIGCNKIALGHHRDDSLETFLMNLFYAGKLQAMPAKYTTSDGRFQVVRPLIEHAESDIRAYAALAKYPILPCNLCGSQTGLKRDEMTRLMDQMEKTNPNLRAVMLHALKNVRPTHLLDGEVLEAWHARAPHIRPDDVVEAREAHAEALPVHASVGRLPILN